jgi:hypothetical protein
MAYYIPETEISFGDLHRYHDGSFLREATEEEREDSRTAATIDGGVGAFTAMVDGEEVTCYVQE